MKESITYVMDLVDEYTGPAEKIIKKAGQMDGEFKDLNDQMKKAGTIKADLNHFGALTNKLDLNSKALKDAREESKKLGHEIANTTNPTKKQIAAFEKSKSTVNKLKRTQTGYRADLKNLSAQLQKTGVDTNKFSLEQRKADATIKKTTKSLDKQLITLTKQAREMAKIQGRADKWDARATKARGSVGAGDVVAAGGALYAMKKLADAYGEVASAQGELKSLDMTTGDIDAVTQKAEALSSEFGKFSQSELIRSSYALKSGMSDLGGIAIAGMLDISAKVAGGTKADIDGITDTMAMGYNIHRKSFEKMGQETIAGWKKMSAEEKDIQFGKYFGGGIAVAVKQFKTDGKQMADAIKGVGDAATSSNVPLAEQIAIMGSLQGKMSGSEAATKYRAFLRTAVKLGKNLNLTVTDGNDRLLSTPAILDKIRGKYGAVLDDMEKAEIQKSMGDEGAAYVAALYDSTDKLKKGITSVNEGMKGGENTYTKMANSIMKGGPAEEFDRLNNITMNLMANMGEGLTPIITSFVNGFAGFAASVGGFIKENKELAGYITIGVTSLIALKVAVVASQFAFGGLFSVMSLGSKALLFYANATKGAAIGTGLMSKAGMVFNAVWAANPLGVIIAATVAAGVAFYALYKNWDYITSKIVEAAVYIDDMFGGVFSALFDKIMMPIRAMMQAYDLVKGLFSDEKDSNINSSLDINKTEKLNTSGVVTAGGAKSQSINSNDTYNFIVPESNDPVIVKNAIKDALAERDREKKLKRGGLMYD